MKKKFFMIMAFALCTISAFAQFLQEPGLRNTGWTGFGNAWNSIKDQDAEKLLDSANWGYIPDDEGTHWTGFTDTFQARISAGSLSIDAMIKWGALSAYKIDELDALQFKCLDKDVNFIYKSSKNFDVGMGTFLNWKLGPAPSHNGNSWESSYHVRQGGLSYGLPSQGLVAGGVYYANFINTSLDFTDPNLKSPIEEENAALAGRYFIEDKLQLAAAIPSGSNTDDFIANVGAVFTPSEIFLIAASYNGIFRKDSHFYTGVSMGVEEISIDAWLGVNNIAGKKDNRITGIGGAINFDVDAWKLRPEAGFTIYEDTDNSLALYLGMETSYYIKTDLKFGLWSSFAFGSDNDSTTKTGGKIFDIKPDLTYFINSTDALSVSYEYQAITTYKDKDFNFWECGFYWTHVF